jgi:hypothetical protein
MGIVEGSFDQFDSDFDQESFAVIGWCVIVLMDCVIAVAVLRGTCFGDLAGLRMLWMRAACVLAA